MTVPKDLVFFTLASLAAASRAGDNVKIRALHVAMASNSIAELEAQLVGMKLQLAGQQAELVRLADAEKAAP